MSSKKKPKEPPPPPEPQVSEAEQVRRHARFILIWTGVFGLGRVVFIGVIVVTGLYVTFALPVQISHGETTTIAVAQNWLVNVDAHVWVSWAAAAGGAIYGLSERRLRRKERAEKDARIQELEKAIDPGRTSSNINQQGNPPSGGTP